MKIKDDIFEDLMFMADKYIEEEDNETSTLLIWAALEGIIYKVYEVKLGNKRARNTISKLSIINAIGIVTDEQFNMVDTCLALRNKALSKSENEIRNEEVKEMIEFTQAFAIEVEGVLNR